MMSVNISLDDKAVKALMNAYPKRIKKSSTIAINKTASRVKDLIQRRTAQGRGINGGFKPYAKSTRKSRSNRGRQVGVVDLFDSGKMMGSMIMKPKNPFLAEVTFLGTPQKRKAMWHHKGLGNLPERPFFDISSAEKPLVASVFIKEFKRRMAR